MLAHHSQQATPPSEGSKPLPITRNANSQTTPHHSSKEDDLARRCRQLARSVGHGAVVETQFGSTTSNTGRDSPSPVRASPSGSPARSPRISGSSLFPLSPTGKPLPPPISPRSSYPTPEGSFTLNEIQEEPSGGDALASIANDASNRPSLSAVISSGALSTDEEDLPIGRVKTSRTSSRMTALNSLKLSGESEPRFPPFSSYLEPIVLILSDLIRPRRSSPALVAEGWCIPFRGRPLAGGRRVARQSSSPNSLSRPDADVVSPLRVGRPR